MGVQLTHLTLNPFSPFIKRYSLAMVEIPVVLALTLREYDLKLLDPLPGMDYRSSFGVVGPTEGPVRVQYKRRY